jgi:hypothetical protein
MLLCMVARLVVSCYTSVGCTTEKNEKNVSPIFFLWKHAENQHGLKLVLHLSNSVGHMLKTNKQRRV